ncbi:cytochrome P450 [Cadophora sp. DSE1049]|nr:cytochrome P450 [Cadophora sp. DSE1049]
MPQLSILPQSFLGLAGLVLAGSIAFQLSIWVYNAFFHPLAKFPGPKIAAASYFPRCWTGIKGTHLQWVMKQFDRYGGDVIRVSPCELVFRGDASKDIYGHKANLLKDPTTYRPLGNEAATILNANFEGHARQRRIFSHAFSDRALKLQEPIFREYVDLLCANVHRDIKENNGVATANVVDLFNFTAFDIMSDLTFGKSLDQVENSAYHPWVLVMFASIKLGVLLRFIRFIPFMPDKVMKQREIHKDFSKNRVEKRLANPNPRPDIWGLTMSNEEGRGLSKPEMYGNCRVFMSAGTETTATLLSGLTYYLLQNPAKMSKLVHEIRSEFKTKEEITIEKLPSLRYLFACLEEGLRMYPPVANGLSRTTGLSSVTIDGHVVPPNTTVSAANYPTFRNPKNFKRPNEFIPERWMPGNKDFESDRKSSFQPWSMGPRNCLGKNLAYHEMRIILATLLWHFDLKLCEESNGWPDKQKNYIVLWEKQPLMCRLRAAKR